tara:strand:+ start:308 stop:520 length:213 start_codon:yes stop_codon:yes gene_type:complete
MKISGVTAYPVIERLAKDYRHGSGFEETEEYLEDDTFGDIHPESEMVDDDWELDAAMDSFENEEDVKTSR